MGIVKTLLQVTTTITAYFLFVIVFFFHYLRIVSLKLNVTCGLLVDVPYYSNFIHKKRCWCQPPSVPRVCKLIFAIPILVWP